MWWESSCVHVCKEDVALQPSALCPACPQRWGHQCPEQHQHPLPYSLPASGEGRQQGLRSPWGLKRILSLVWWAERWESPRNEVTTSPGTRAGSLQAERAALQGEGVTVHGYFGILFSFPTCCFYSLVLFTF